LDLSQVSMLEKRVDFLTRIVVSDLQVETVWMCDASKQSGEWQLHWPDIMHATEPS
jgi:hypothetical protein